MKGQVLVAIGVIVCIVVILISIESDYVQTLYEKESEAEEILTNSLENLKQEYIKVVKIALSSDASLSNVNKRIGDFSAFVDKKLSSQKFLLFYSIGEAYEGNLKIAVGNFLQEAIENITVEQNLTNENTSIAQIPTGGSRIVEFDISSITSLKVYKVNISYTGSSSKNTFEETYTGEANSKRRFSIYYNLRLRFKNSTLRERFQINEAI